MITALLCYLAAINVLAFVLFGIDKYKAKRERWRIPEATLMWIAALGGSIGAWLGISIWHHKTKHAKFQIGVPMILLAQVILVALIAGYWLSR